MTTLTNTRRRPKYLSPKAILFEIRLPIPGWVSILHRVSGVLLFVATAWLLFILDRSLVSEAGFEWAKQYLASPLPKTAILVLLWAYCHHLCAGVRFLLLDLSLGIELPAARLGGILVLVASLGLTALSAWVLW